MLTTILGAIALVATGIAGAVFGMRVRDQVAMRARLAAHRAEFEAAAQRRMADAEADAPRDRDALVRELRGNGQL